MNIWIIIGVVVGLVLVLSLLFSIASFSGDRFFQIYQKLNKTKSGTSMNILDFIHSLNFNYFKNKLKIKKSIKEFENFYNSKHKLVVISENLLKSNSLASFAVVAHEMGHALQDKNGNKLKVLNTLRKFGFLFGFLFFPTLIIGLILFFIGNNLFLYGIILLSVSAFTLILSIFIKFFTISIEKDATNKGLNLLKDVLSEQELIQCKKLLNSAKLTYWADLIRLLFSWTFLTKKTKMFN